MRSRSVSGRNALVFAVALPSLLLQSFEQALAASIIIVNKDGPGEGFNDSSPFTAVGDNVATTLGQARLNAFTHAAKLWGARLVSQVEIKVDAQMNPLDCGLNYAVIGNAGPNTVDRDFPSNDATYGPPRANTWYAQALANAFAGFDRTATLAEISAEFNSSLGVGTCAPASSWYLGLDGRGGSFKLDLVSVVFHELAHGLGFSSFIDESTGARLSGRDDAFTNRLMLEGGSPTALSAMTDAQRLAAIVGDPNLTWAGPATAAYVPALSAGRTNGRVRMHAPNPVEFGSSVGHFSADVSPNELMEPYYNGANHKMGLALPVMNDIGWLVIPATVSDGCLSGLTGASDVDADGVIDTCDNCPAVSNPLQSDADANGRGDACQGANVASVPAATPLHLGLLASALLVLGGAFGIPQPSRKQHQ